MEHQKQNLQREKDRQRRREPTTTASHPPRGEEPARRRQQGRETERPYDDHESGDADPGRERSWEWPEETDENF